MSKKIGAIVAGVSLFTLVGAFALFNYLKEEEINVQIINNNGRVENGYYKYTFRYNQDEIQITSQNEEAMALGPYKINNICFFLKSCSYQDGIVIVLNDETKVEIRFFDQDRRDNVYDKLRRKYQKRWKSFIFDYGEVCLTNDLIKFNNGKLFILNTNGEVLSVIDFKNIRDINRDHIGQISINNQNNEIYKLPHLKDLSRINVYWDLKILQKIYQHCPDTTDPKSVLEPKIPVATVA